MKKRRISIRWMALIPIVVIGIVALVSNSFSLSNTKEMNGTASQIADVYMEGISELSEIQKEVQMLHNYALAHIIATDQESLVNLVECARTTEALLESDLQNFQKCLLDEQRASFDKVQQDYYLLKDDVSRQEMEVVGGEVQESVIHSNENASDLSAVTEELSATMEETSNKVNEILQVLNRAIEEGAKGVNGAAESTQTLVEDMEVISERMRQNQNIAKSLEAGTAMFEKF